MIKKILFYPNLLNPLSIVLSILFILSYIFISNSIKQYFRFVLERILYVSLNTFIFDKRYSDNLSIYLAFIILPNVKRKSFAYKRKSNSLYNNL